MRNIRKLYLQNGEGDRWGLNGENNVYASGLSGFGFTLSPEFADLSRGFFSSVSDQSEPQNPIPFTLTFTKHPYDTYQRFVNWLCGIGPLTLIYNPTGKTEYCRDVSVNFIQKGELNAVGWLECPCSLFCLTPWYLPSPTTLSLEAGGSDQSKRYTYEYSDALVYGEDNAASISGTIAGAGHVPGALDLRFYGAITNPRIRLTGNISGKTYGICSVKVTLNPSDQLIFSSRYDNSFVKKIAANGDETDLMDVLNLQTTPFFHIPVDEPCTILVEADAAFTGYANLLVYYYYRSV